MNMKKILAYILILALAHSGSAVAGITTYTDTAELYKEVVATDSYTFWEHDNPAEIIGGGPMTPAEYEQAVLQGDVTSVTLTIVLDSLEPSDTISAWIRDQELVWHNVGLLEKMSTSDGFGYVQGAGVHDPSHRTSTTFDLDPGWLNGLPVLMALVPGNTVSNPFEVETAELSVTVTTAPAPSAILLGSIGVAFVGWLRKRRRL